MSTIRTFREDQDRILRRERAALSKLQRSVLAARPQDLDELECIYERHLSVYSARLKIIIKSLRYGIAHFERENDPVRPWMKSAPPESRPYPLRLRAKMSPADAPPRVAEAA